MSESIIPPASATLSLPSPVPVPASAPAPDKAAPAPKSGGKRSRGGALLLSREETVKLKRAAIDQPDMHKGITYTDDPVEAAGRGYVVAVSPRTASEIRDPTAVVEEAKDVVTALGRFDSMTDEYIKNKFGGAQSGVASIRDSRARFYGK